MLSATFAEKLKPFQITVNACHAGDVNSVLSNNLGFGGHETPDQGAEMSVWLATHPISQEITGRYFEQLTETNCPFAQDKETVNALFEVCAHSAKKNYAIIHQIEVPNALFTNGYHVIILTNNNFK